MAGLVLPSLHLQRVGGGSHHAVLTAGDGDQLCVGLVDLEEVATEDAEEKDHEGGEDREDLAELLAVRAEAVGEALGQVAHRAGGDRALGMHLAARHAEGDLDELGRQAGQTAQDHPERAQRFGVDALVGRRAHGVSEVTGLGGRVRIDGEEWTARSYDETLVVPAGRTGDVIEINGATAIVHPRD